MLHSHYRNNPHININNDASVIRSCLGTIEETVAVPLGETINSLEKTLYYLIPRRGVLIFPSAQSSRGGRGGGETTGRKN